MPCDGSYLAPTEREKESVAVLEFLREVHGQPFDHDRPASVPYGSLETLDRDIAELCAWCKNNEVAAYSLELRLWWKRHQKADEEKEARIRATREMEQARASAIGKLTAEERRALGIKEEA